MRVLALDIGDARCGIASGNTKTCTSSPVQVLPTEQILQNAQSWKRILQDYEPQLLVFGMPKSMSAECGKQAAHVKELAEKIALTAGLEAEFVDERLSSSQAKCVMHESGLSEKQMRGKLDAVAASLFLETWLKRRKA